MKQKLLYLILSITLIANANAQKAAQSVYVELGGPGILSVNYDTRFTKQDDGIGGRIGVGGYNFDGESMLAIPLGLTYLLGKDDKNYFEVGGGVTFINYKTDDTYFEPGGLNSTFGHLTFGYRLQPKNGGFLFRAAIVPIITKNGFIPYYAGIGFGYKF